MSVELEVDEVDAGARLDVLLVRRVEGLSRARARRMIQDGQVRLNGRFARKGTRVGRGDVLRLESVPAPVSFAPTPSTEVELIVLHEDADLVVVDKPAGVPTHPLRADERATLANALVARYPEMQGVGYAPREPGLVHRLDNETSGVVLAARSTEIFEELRDALRAGAIEKTYTVLVDGVFEGPMIIDSPIAKHPSDPRRVHVCGDPLDRRLPAARPARTEVRSAERVGSYTLLEVSAPVATRHQIRAHLASRGHALVGDWLYGGTSHEDLGRHFLHARSLSFAHPTTGARLRVEAPLPPELETFLRSAT